MRFEEYTRFKDFGAFHRNQASAFKKHLSILKAKRSHEGLALATVLSTLNHLKAFYKWLAQQPGYKSKVHVPDLGYFNLTDKENRAAKAPKFRQFPTLDQIRRVIFSMPTQDDIAKRNRALIAFTIVTGIRVQAMVSLKLKHVDLEKKLVIQDPREVKTKFSKHINSFFFPILSEMTCIKFVWTGWAT